MLFDQGFDIPSDIQNDALSVELGLERVRYNLRIRSAELTAFKKASGLKLPTKIGGTSRNGSQFIAKFGPDEWVLSDDPKNAIKLSKLMVKLSKDFVISATDISHRNIAFIIKGPMARRAVNVGCPLDLSLEAFSIGKATRTIFENAPIQLYRAGKEEFHVECWRSFGPYLRDFLLAFARDL